MFGQNAISKQTNKPPKPKTNQKTPNYVSISILLSVIVFTDSSTSVGLLDGITDSMEMNLGRLWEIKRGRDSWRAAVQGVAESDTTELLNNSLSFPEGSSSGDPFFQEAGASWKPSNGTRKSTGTGNLALKMSRVKR